MDVAFDAVFVVFGEAAVVVFVTFGELCAPPVVFGLPVVFAPVVLGPFVFGPPVAGFGAGLPCDTVVFGACDPCDVGGFAPPPC